MRLQEFVVKYWVQWTMGMVAGFLTLGYRQLGKRLKAANAENDALKQGIKALLRDRIIQGYNHYTDKGCWPIYARDSMLDMYRQYAALGGNGTVSHLMEDLKELPTER